MFEQLQLLDIPKPCQIVFGILCGGCGRPISIGTFSTEFKVCKACRTEYTIRWTGTQFLPSFSFTAVQPEGDSPDSPERVS